jgi:hypothetical protein
VNASRLALVYCANLGMGTSLLVMPPTGTALSFPLPAARMAESLLETLMDETKRLMREKAYAVHALANALLEQGELIGPELEEVFKTADAANPDAAGPFERKLFTLPRLFDEPGQQQQIVEGQGWPGEAGAAAASAARRGHGQPGVGQPGLVQPGHVQPGVGQPEPPWPSSADPAPPAWIPAQGWTTDPTDSWPIS